MCRRIWILMMTAVLLVTMTVRAEEIDFSAEEEQKEETATPELSEQALEEGIPVPMGSASVLLAEMETGQVIFAKNADERRQVASVTKMMTILMALEAVDSGRVSTEQMVSVTENASGMGGSQVLLDTGETQTYGVLLKSMIVGSANDAAVAVAECLYGSEALFVEKMNERCEEIGMEDTKFVNCTGLPEDGQYTTAGDVAKMALVLYRNPRYFEYSGIWMDEVDHGDGRITQLTNTNKLLKQYDGCDGGKTGSTNAAGYCICATAKRGDIRLVAVVLGGGTSRERFQDASEMFDYGFANYRLYPVAKSGTRVRGQIPVVGGDVSGLTVQLGGDLTLLLPKGGETGIAMEPELPESVTAPVAADDTIGSVRVVRDGDMIAEIPVTACHAVKAKGMGSAIRRIWEGWMME